MNSYAERVRRHSRLCRELSDLVNDIEVYKEVRVWTERTQERMTKEMLEHIQQIDAIEATFNTRRRR